MSANNGHGAPRSRAVARVASSLEAMLVGQINSAMPIETRIRHTAETLAPLYKRLNAQWEAIEQRLRSELPAREVWYTYRSYNVDPHGNSPWEIHHCIGLVKYRGEWRICHGTFRSPEEGSPDCGKPIVECAVAERIDAVEHVGKLREAILRAAENSIPHVLHAVERLSDVLKNW